VGVGHGNSVVDKEVTVILFGMAGPLAIGVAPGDVWCVDMELVVLWIKSRAGGLIGRKGGVRGGDEPFEDTPDEKEDGDFASCDGGGVRTGAMLEEVEIAGSNRGVGTAAISIGLPLLF